MLIYLVKPCFITFCSQPHSLLRMSRRSFWMKPSRPSRSSPSRWNGAWYVSAQHPPGSCWHHHAGQHMLCTSYDSFTWFTTAQTFRNVLALIWWFVLVGFIIFIIIIADALMALHQFHPHIQTFPWLYKKTKRFAVHHHISGCHLGSGSHLHGSFDGVKNKNLMTSYCSDTFFVLQLSKAGTEASEPLKPQI